MNWMLIAGLSVMVVLIVVLMRPEIFFKAFLGDRISDKPKRILRPLSEEEFKARMTDSDPKGGSGTVQTETKKEDDHG